MSDSLVDKILGEKSPLVPISKTPHDEVPMQHSFELNALDLQRM
jgi:hypothetical protein